MKFEQAVLLSLASAVMAGKAPIVKKNPADTIAIADFPQYGIPIMGNVVFTAKEGKQVNVHVDVTKLPKTGGPFYYHIHEHAIPESGDCEAAGLHFNPYKASPDCDAQKSDAHCQVGDLSGKHGWINTTCFETKYDDPFLSLNSKSKSFIIGKSLVLHDANMKKLACANIVKADDARLQGLEAEYSKNGNPDLQELQQFLTSNYAFTDGEEVFEPEVARIKRELGIYESGEIEEEEDEEPIEEEDSVDGAKDCCNNKDHHHHNHTNSTNISSIDCENKAPVLISQSIMFAIGVGVGAALIL